VILDIQTIMASITTQLVDASGEHSEILAGIRSWKSAVGAGKFPPHVLVVDDEPLIRWSVAESLSGLGLDVEQAPDAVSALRIVTTTALPFDVIVLDLRLPDMHDLSLLAILRQLLPKARLILMTAFGTTDIITEAALLGATVIYKPFELLDLNRLVLMTDQMPS
jgi:DNA-binding NtrC family response regulator